MNITITGAVPRFAGFCAACNKALPPGRLWEGVLGKAGGKYVVLHTSCAGGRWRNKIGGAKVWTGPDTVEVTP